MMGWMMDEYIKITGEFLPGVVTGKPLCICGSLGRREATGFGVVVSVREALKFLNLTPETCRASIMGFGNVAQYAAISFVRLGGTVVCVSYWNRNDKRAYTISKPGGADPFFLQSITDQYGAIDNEQARRAGYEIEHGDAWLSKEVEVLIPAAVEACNPGDCRQDQLGQSHRRGDNGPALGRTALRKPERSCHPGLCNAGGYLFIRRRRQNSMDYAGMKE